jgi:Subtilase family/Ricin-type beta-trefoil lectin domain-like
MLKHLRLLTLLGIITLTGCGNLNQAPIAPIDNKPSGYLVTLNVTDGSSQATLEQRYSGTTLVFDAASGFAMLHTSKAPAAGDPAVKSVQENAEAVAPEPKPAGEVQLDGSTSWGGGSSSWSNGIGSWGSGSTSWSNGSASWGNGSTSWGNGSTSWGRSTVVPALPIENQTTWNQIKLYEAHRLSRNFGGGIKVAVIDSGIDLNHPVFAGKLSASTEFWDYVDNDATPQDEAGGSGYGHGTAVAGIILQVAPRAKILPIRVLKPDGTADTAKVVQAIAQAVSYNADIINLSLGTDGYDQSLMDVCAWANSRGVRIIGAAGNNGQKDNMDSPALFSWYPATYQMTIGVGSVNANDQRSSFSSYGDAVFAFAPGENIWSAYPGNKSGNFTGTSFAAPIVTGAVALAMSEMPNANNRNRVIYDPTSNVPPLWNSLDWPTALSNNASYVRGRLNLENFIRNLPDWSTPTDIQAGIYQVVNVKSNKCLDVVNGGVDDGVEVKQYTCSTGDNQRWQIEPVGAGLYKLKAVHSGRALSIGGGTPGNEVNGAKAIQWEDGNYNTQQWLIEASGSGYRLVVNHSGKCLNVANGSISNLAALIQQVCSITTNQQFKLKALF